MKKISCIIPAYNEEKSIAQVLAVVTPLVGSFLEEIIVVDDASSDGTKKIVQGFPVRLIEHTLNEGKSKSVADGITSAKGNYIFLLDADLLSLNTQNILDLIEPIEQGISDVAMSYRKNAWPLFPFKKIDYLTGERILPISSLNPTLSDMALLPSYGLEVFLNKIIIREHLRIAVVGWPNVENDLSQKKRGWWKGIRSIIKIWSNVLSTVSLFEMYSQNIRMQKQLIH